MFFTASRAIWLYQKPIDFRKGLNSLILLLADQLNFNPGSGELFLFRDRSSKKIKLLYFDGNGFWLFYKRLERGRLKFPEINDKVMELTSDQLSWLLSGLDLSKHKLLPKITPCNFY
jgi:transposase